MQNEIKIREELTELINRNSAESGSNTPDYILAEYLINCLKNFNQTVYKRDNQTGKNTDSILP